LCSCKFILSESTLVHQADLFYEQNEHF